MDDYYKQKREKLLKALNKPDCPDVDCLGDDEFFDPWEDIIKGICGSYNSRMDYIFIRTLEAVKTRETFYLIATGFEYEFVLYVLSRQDYTNYGTSPRGGWPDDWCADLWDKIIEKWKAYYNIAWGQEYEA